jgi:peptide/nickel transport system permease protein
MGRRSFLVRRVLGLVAAVCAVVTFVFLYFEMTPYLEAGSGEGIPVAPGAPLTERYFDWLAWLVTVPEPVFGPLAEASGYTLVYLVPAMCLAVIAGTVLRVYSVARETDLLDRSLDVAGLVGLSVPAFVLAFFLGEFFLAQYLSVLGRLNVYDPNSGPFSSENLTAAVWPFLAMAGFLFAAQLHYAGEQLRAYASEPFVKTARAKGLSDWRTGWHLFRNTAVTLLSVLLTDMYGTVLVAVFAVEFATKTPGIGTLIARATIEADLALLLGLALALALVGVLATFAEDLAYAVTDPRVEFDE